MRLNIHEIKKAVQVALDWHGYLILEMSPMSKCYTVDNGAAKPTSVFVVYLKTIHSMCYIY